MQTPKIGMLARLLSLLLAESGINSANLTLVESVRLLGGVDVETKPQAWVWLREEWFRRSASINTMRQTMQIAQSLKKLPAFRKKAARRRETIISPGFYSSPEWRAIRFDVLKACGGCCNLCGRSNRAHGVVIHVDHIKPRSKFPELALTRTNLQALCEDCNMGKSNRDTTDWR